MTETLGITDSIPVVVSNDLATLSHDDDWDGFVEEYAFFRSGLFFFTCFVSMVTDPTVERLFPNPERVEPIVSED